MRRSGSPNYSGKVFEKSFQKSVESQGHKAFRITDAMYSLGNGAVGAQPSLADFWVFLLGDGFVSVVLAECKAVSGKSLPFNRLAEHQFNALLDVEGMHETSHGVIPVNFYDKDDVRKCNRLFVVPVDVWKEYVESGSRKSLPISACEDDVRIIECKRVGSIWDVSPWVGSNIEKE